MLDIFGQRQEMQSPTLMPSSLLCSSVASYRAKDSDWLMTRAALACWPAIVPNNRGIRGSETAVQRQSPPGGDCRKGGYWTSAMWQLCYSSPPLEIPPHDQPPLIPDDYSNKKIVVGCAHIFTVIVHRVDWFNQQVSARFIGFEIYFAHLLLKRNELHFVERHTISHKYVR